MRAMQIPTATAICPSRRTQPDASRCDAFQPRRLSTLTYPSSTIVVERMELAMFTRSRSYMIRTRARTSLSPIMRWRADGIGGCDRTRYKRLFRACRSAPRIRKQYVCSSSFLDHSSAFPLASCSDCETTPPSAREQRDRPDEPNASPLVQVRQSYTFRAG